MDPISAIATLVTSVVSRVWPDKSEKDKQEFTLAITKELNANQVILKQLDVDAEQIKTNTEQAKSSNFFVSGARPMIMWGLGLVLVFYALCMTCVNVAIALGYSVVVMPPMDPMMRDIILGLLGLGYLTRSYDKKQQHK